MSNIKESHIFATLDQNNTEIDLGYFYSIQIIFFDQILDTLDFGSLTIENQDVLNDIANNGFFQSNFDGSKVEINTKKYLNQNFTTLALKEIPVHIEEPCNLKNQNLQSFVKLKLLDATVNTKIAILIKNI